jgi:hypothetical protein
MISKRIRTMANEIKTICQTEEPAISDGGFWIAERKRGIRGLPNSWLYLSEFRFPKSEIALWRRA